MWLSAQLFINMQPYCPFSALEPYPALTGTHFTFTTFRAPQIVILNPFATEHADSVKIVKEPSELWTCLQFSTPITEVSAFMGPISDRRFIAIRSPVGTNHGEGLGKQDGSCRYCPRRQCRIRRGSEDENMPMPLSVHKNCIGRVEDYPQAQFLRGPPTDRTGSAHIDLPEDDANVLQLIFNVVHNRVHSVLDTLSADQLMHLAITGDKHDCWGSLMFFPIHLARHVRDVTIFDGIMAYALVAYLAWAQKSCSLRPQLRLCSTMPGRTEICRSMKSILM